MGLHDHQVIEPVNDITMHIVPDSLHLVVGHPMHRPPQVVLVRMNRVVVDPERLNVGHLQRPLLFHHARRQKGPHPRIARLGIRGDPNNSASCHRRLPLLLEKSLATESRREIECIRFDPAFDGSWPLYAQRRATDDCWRWIRG